MNVFELEGSISLDSSAYEKAVKDAMKDGENLGKSLQENAKQFQAMQAQIDSLSKELTDSKADIERMRSELAKSAKAADENASATSEMKSELDKAEKAIDDISESLDDERKSADKAGKETNEYGDSAEEAAGDTKKLDKEADKLGGTFGGLGEKIGKVAGAIKTGLVTAAKIGVGAVAAAGAAVSGIVMKSVSGFGEYEQLKGGAQKIFEGIDFTKIQKDADNAFKELNMNAAEYFGSINLAGASFTQTMGADKAYDTARRGMLAISDFATGTGKSIDELNQKYQMITRSTTSYQSIADQFSGILPQTSNDFLEQAQAAGLLSEEYQKLTEVPVAEYQEALTLMLEKGVEAQGLARNTVNESERTITGSVATAKKAWEDLIVAFSDPDADLGAKISNFVDSGKAALENLIPTIVNAMTGIGTAVKDLAPVIGNEIPKLIQELVPPLIQATTGLVSSVVSSIPDLLIQVGNALINSVNMLEKPLENIIYNLSDLIQKSLPVLIPIVLELFKSILSSVATLSSALLPELANIIVTLFEALREQDTAEVVLTLINALSDIFMAVADSALIIFDNLAPILTTITDLIIKGFDEHGDEIGAAVNKMLLNLLAAVTLLLTDGIIAIFSAIGQPAIIAIIELFEGLFLPIADKLSDWGVFISEWGLDLWAKIADWFKEKIDKFAEFFESIGEKIYDFKDDVKKKIGEIVDTITSKFTGLIDTAKSWGKDLIDNFVSGISDNVYKVGEAVGSVAGKVKDLIGFSEPKEGALSNFHTFAPDMIDLFAQGIRDNADEVYREIRALSEGISTDINANVAVGGTGAEVGTGGSITVQVINNWDGTRIDSELDMAEIIQSMSDRAVIAMSERLEQLRIFDTRAYGGVVLP